MSYSPPKKRRFCWIASCDKHVIPECAKLCSQSAFLAHFQFITIESSPDNVRSCLFSSPSDSPHHLSRLRRRFPRTVWPDVRLMSRSEAEWRADLCLGDGEHKVIRRRVAAPVTSTHIRLSVRTCIHPSPQTAGQEPKEQQRNQFLTA